MPILLFGVELEILKEASAAEHDKFFQEAALAHRARAECLRLAEKLSAAETDEKYASKLGAQGKKVAAEPIKPPSPAAPTNATAHAPKNPHQPCPQSNPPSRH